jgi:hypothetical protein
MKVSKNESISSLLAERCSQSDFYRLLMISAEHFFNTFHHRGFAFRHSALTSFSSGPHWNGNCLSKGHTAQAIDASAQHS